MALMEKAAGQGHAYAMHALERIQYTWKEYEQAVKWATKGAEAGLSRAMYNVGCCLDAGEGVAAPDYPAAADWYRRAADGGDVSAANNLSNMYTVGRGGAWQLLPACHVICHILVEPGRLCSPRCVMPLNSRKEGTKFGG